MSSASQLFVLGWHNIVPSWRFGGSRALLLAGFAAQIALLHRVGRVVALEDALTRLKRGEQLPARAVALTFDDGYADVVDVVAAMLSKRRLPATFFLCPGFLGGTAAPHWEMVAWAIDSAQASTLDWGGRTHRLGSRRERRRLTARVAGDLKGLDLAHRDDAVARIVDECRPTGDPHLDRLMLGSGGAARLVDMGFTVGSHTVNHPILRRETDAVQAAEIAGSRAALARLLGFQPTVFAYPNGQSSDFSARTRELVADAGYQYALTTVHGGNDATTSPTAVRRVMVDPRHGAAALLRLPPLLGAQRATSAPDLTSTGHHEGC